MKKNKGPKKPIKTSEEKPPQGPKDPPGGGS